MPSSFIRSTMDVRQFSFCGVWAAQPSSIETTSTMAMGSGLGGGGGGTGTATGADVGAAGAVGVTFGGGGTAFFFRPSFSSIDPNKLMAAPYGSFR